MEEEEVDLLHVACVVEHIVDLLVRVFLFVRSQERRSWGTCLI